MIYFQWDSPHQKHNLQTYKSVIVNNYFLHDAHLTWKTILSSIENKGYTYHVLNIYKKDSECRINLKQLQPFWFLPGKKNRGKIWQTTPNPSATSTKSLDEQTASVHFPPCFQLALEMLRSTSNNYIFGYSVVSSFMLAHNTTIINSRVMHSIEQMSWHSREFHLDNII